MWLREDLSNLLQALARTASRYQGDFRTGYLDALGDVAQALDVEQPAAQPVLELRPLEGVRRR